MAVSTREFGFDPAPAAHGARGRPSLLVLVAAPPPTLPPTTRIILHDALLEAEHILRLSREVGAPVPLMPPVPARDARRLRELLLARGVRAEVHPLGSFLRFRAAFPSRDVDAEEAVARAVQFATRALICEAEVTGLAAVLREAIANALRHGNGEDPARGVRLDLILTADLLTIVVEDEGSGFDHAAVMAEIERTGGDAVVRAEEQAAAGRRGGLGLLMIRRWADAVEWARDGRQIRIVKQVR